MIFSTVFSCSVYILFSCSIYLLFFCCQNCQHLPNVVKMREKNLEMFSKIFFQIIWHSIQCFHILYAFPLVFKTSTVSVLPSKAQMLFLMFCDFLNHSLTSGWIPSSLSADVTYCNLERIKWHKMTSNFIQIPTQLMKQLWMWRICHLCWWVETNWQILKWFSKCYFRLGIKKRFLWYFDLICLIQT